MQLTLTLTEKEVYDTEHKRQIRSSLDIGSRAWSLLKAQNEIQEFKFKHSRDVLWDDPPHLERAATINFHNFSRLETNSVKIKVCCAILLEPRWRLAFKSDQVEAADRWLESIIWVMSSYLDKVTKWYQYSRTSIIRTSIIRTFSLVPFFSWILITFDLKKFKR